MGVGNIYFTQKELSRMDSRDWPGYSEDMFYEDKEVVAALIYVNKEDYGVALKIYNDCYFSPCKNINEAYSKFSNLKLGIKNKRALGELIDENKLTLRCF